MTLDRFTIKAAEALGAALRATLESDRHTWYLGRTDPDRGR